MFARLVGLKNNLQNTHILVYHNKMKDKNNLSSTQLAKILLKIRSAALMQEFLEAVLTPDELKSITTRIKIVRLLKQKKLSHHEIANKLGVGVATVTRGMRELKLNHFKNIEAGN